MDIKPCKSESGYGPRDFSERDFRETEHDMCCCTEHCSVNQMKDQENHILPLKQLCCQMIDYEEHLPEVSQDLKTSDCKDSTVLNLTELPSEVLLILFSYMDARFTLGVLTCVCKLFHQLLTPESIWMSRFKKIWPNRDVTGVTKYIASWKQLCVQTEEMYRFWCYPQEDLKYFQLRQHFAPVDAVHVMLGGTICLSGSRDRKICVWNLTNLDLFPPDHRHTPSCTLSDHQGWVWTLASDPSGAPAFASGSWDSTVRLWDLPTQKETTVIRKEHKAAVLCLAWRPDALITGSYDKHVRVFDLRGSPRAVSSYCGHKRPVLSVVANDEYIITGGEDKTLVVYDRRAAAIMKTIKTQSPVFSLLASTSGQYLLAGLRAGQICLYETISGTFEPLQTIETGHENKVTGLCESHGAIVSCSSDHVVKVMDPCEFSSLCSFTNHNLEVASVHSQGPVLAAASSDLTVGIWRR